MTPPREGVGPVSKDEAPGKDASDSQRKRRRRGALSCDNCRVKKTKCDRQLPCGRCVRLMMPHLCVYSSATCVNNTAVNYTPPAHISSMSSVHSVNPISDKYMVMIPPLNHAPPPQAPPPPPPNPPPPANIYPTTSLPPLVANRTPSASALSSSASAPFFFSSYNSVADEHKDLYLGVNPVDDPNSPVAFYPATVDADPKMAQKYTHSTFSILCRDDYGLELMFERITRNKIDIEDASLKTLLGYKHSSVVSRIERQTSSRYGDANITAEFASQQEARTVLSRTLIKFGFVFCRSYPRDGSLEDRIVACLAQMMPMTDYLDLFIDSGAFGYMPIIDEEETRAAINRIFSGRPSTEGVLSLSSDEDYDWLGLFFVIAISATTHLLSIDYEGNIPENYGGIKSKVVEMGIPVETVFVIQSLSKYNMMRQYSFVAIQFSLLWQIVDQSASLQRIIKGTTQVSVGVLIQMAIALGLQIDPDTYGSTLTPRQKVLRRVVWYQLLWLDTFDSMATGMPLFIIKDSYSTKPPSITEDGNLLRPELSTYEKAVIERYIKFMPLIIDLRELCLETAKIRPQAKLGKVLELAGDVEVSLARLFGRYSNFVGHDYTVPPTMKSPESGMSLMLTTTYSFYIRTKLYLTRVYFRMYTHFQKRGNVDLEFFYLRKLLALLLVDLCEFAHHSKHVAMLPGERSGMFPSEVNPFLHQYFFQVSLVLLSMYIRLDMTPTPDPKLRLAVEFNKSHSRLITLILYYCLREISNFQFVSYYQKKNLLYLIISVEMVSFEHRTAPASEVVGYRFSPSQHQELGNIFKYWLDNCKFSLDSHVEYVNSLEYLRSLDAQQQPSVLSITSRGQALICEELLMENFWRQLKLAFTFTTLSPYPTWVEVEGPIVLPQKEEEDFWGFF